MTACRRTNLPELDSGPVSNPGLVFMKWLKAQEDGAKTEVPKLLDVLSANTKSAPYEAAFKRWKGVIEQRCASVKTAECSGPLAIGLGNESPLEVGLTFNHTYGMPLIPGSAIKGLLRRAARDSGLVAEDLACLFGSHEEAGAIVFFDAWYDPSSVEGKPFHRDVVTVHHPKYYSSRGQTPPTDFDDPTPVPFLVVRPGATFVFAIKGPSPELEAFAFRLLGWAVENLGVGAKTNAGYGRLMLVGVATQARAAAAATTWQNVLVSYDAGRGMITAAHDGNTAFADRASSDKLLAELPEIVRLALKGSEGQKRRPIQADIDVAHIGGKNYQIIAIRPREAN